MYHVENSHEPIIDKETFALVQQELTRRAKKRQLKTQAPSTYLFTGLLHYGLCEKNFRRKIAAVGSKYEKPVWICSTFKVYGKIACPAQQIPESILIEKTSEVLGTTDWDRDILLDHIAEIQVPGHNRLIYVFRDSHTKEVTWQNPSRRGSWTEEMKQAARDRQLEITERRRNNNGTS